MFTVWVSEKKKDFIQWRRHFNSTKYFIFCWSDTTQLSPQANNEWIMPMMIFPQAQPLPMWLETISYCYPGQLHSTVSLSCLMWHPSSPMMGQHLPLNLSIHAFKGTKILRNWGNLPRYGLSTINLTTLSEFVDVIMLQCYLIIKYCFLISPWIISLPFVLSYMPTPFLSYSQFEIKCCRGPLEWHPNIFVQKKRMLHACWPLPTYTCVYVVHLDLKYNLVPIPRSMDSPLASLMNTNYSYSCLLVFYIMVFVPFIQRIILEGLIRLNIVCKFQSSI